MGLSKKLVWKLYAGALGVTATVVSQKLVTMAWEASTGDTPPDPNDPEVPATRALIWAVSSGLGVGLAQMMVNRFVTRRWMADTGEMAPSRLSSKLDVPANKKAAKDKREAVAV